MKIHETCKTLGVTSASNIPKALFARRKRLFGGLTDVLGSPAKPPYLISRLYKKKNGKTEKKKDTKTKTKRVDQARRMDPIP